MKIAFNCTSETDASKETLALLKQAAAVICPTCEIHETAEGGGDGTGDYQIQIDGRAVDLGSAEYGPVPPRWLIEAELLRTQNPKGVLFLCVANSARSQIGEGVARKLAPSGVLIQSAGSHPTSVRPEAATVMAEIGIDTGSHFSKNVADIDPKTVDTVITLCAEEECPLFLGQATRLHWGLPDPASVKGGDEVRLEAFRQTRDELLRRIRVIWP